MRLLFSKADLVLVVGAVLLTIAMVDHSSATLFPWHNIDEDAHYSYVQHLIHHHFFWPDFNDFHMYAAGVETTKLNYLNHPPLFYFLPTLLSIESPFTYRMYGLCFYSLCIWAYVYFGYKLHLHISESIAYAMVPWTLYMWIGSGFFNNDAWAILGGCLSCLGTLEWLQNNAQRRSIWLISLGILLASAKLTSFLLVGCFVVLVLVFTWRQRIFLRSTNYSVIFLSLAASALPYLYFIYRYGSPTPNTPGQLQQLSSVGEHPSMSLMPWLICALSNFVDQLKGQTELTFLPVLLVIWGGIKLVSSSTFPKNSARRILISASCISTLIVLTIHLTFSYERYIKYGWLYDSLIRYYFPLLPIYGLTIVELISSLHKSKSDYEIAK